MKVNPGGTVREMDYRGNKEEEPPECWAQVSDALLISQMKVWTSPLFRNVVAFGNDACIHHERLFIDSWEKGGRPETASAAVEDEKYWQPPQRLPLRRSGRREWSLKTPVLSGGRIEDATTAAKPHGQTRKVDTESEAVFLWGKGCLSPFFRLFGQIWGSLERL